MEGDVSIGIGGGGGDKRGAVVVAGSDVASADQDVGGDCDVELSSAAGISPGEGVTSATCATSTAVDVFPRVSTSCTMLSDVELTTIIGPKRSSTLSTPVRRKGLHEDCSTCGDLVPSSPELSPESNDSVGSTDDSAEDGEAAGGPSGDAGERSSSVGNESMTTSGDSAE